MLARRLALFFAMSAIAAGRGTSVAGGIEALNSDKGKEVVHFLRSDASGDMYLDGLTHIPLPPTVNTNMVLSSNEDQALGKLFGPGSDTTYEQVNKRQLGFAIVADTAQKVVVISQHCCSLQQFSVVKYSGKLPSSIAVTRMPSLTFAGFRLGSSFADVTSLFGFPLKKSADGSIWYYFGPRPNTPQTCGREWQLRFTARRLSAVTISEGC